jgi:dihydropteroate synthase
MGRTTIFPQDRVTIVGVLNLTPDSFSDGGRYVRAPEDAPDLGRVARDAEAMVAAGADVLDLGGESTRPGARPVPAALEIRRTAPAIEALAKRLAVPLSIDTRKADVARAALDAGAVLVNDVSGLRHDPELGAVVARRGAGLILGHLRGEPETMQADVRFDDVVAEVADELRASVERACAAGVAVERIAADPGIGFGKRLPQNLALLANVGRLRARVGVPILVGPSRKSFLGELTGDPPEARDLATHAACAVAIFAGADAVRVHDVAGARRVAAIALALRQARADASP